MMPSLSILVSLLAITGTLSSPLQAREVIATVGQQTVVAASTPIPAAWQWDRGAVADIPIHPSCNATQHTYIRKGLNEAIALAAHARDHLLRWGHLSPYTVKYFGNASTAEPIGWYSRIVSADRGNMTFRCDDPDRNCFTQDGWAGHWRGENGTHETVLCPLTFTSRLPLEQLCMHGTTVANSELHAFFAVDLLHRLYHVSQITEDAVGHYSENYTDALDLARNNATYAIKDSDVLQLFAWDVYAYDIAVPGVGCSGDTVAQELVPIISSSLLAAASESSVVLASMSSVRATATPSPTAPTSALATPTAASASQAASTSAAAACHTHADGDVHCGPE